MYRPDRRCRYSLVLFRRSKVRSSEYTPPPEADGRRSAVGRRRRSRPRQKRKLGIDDRSPRVRTPSDTIASRRRVWRRSTTNPGSPRTERRRVTTRSSARSEYASTRSSAPSTGTEERRVARLVAEPTGAFADRRHDTVVDCLLCLSGAYHAAPSSGGRGGGTGYPSLSLAAPGSHPID